MIQYIFHKDLDFKKYNACIQNAYNSRIYAFSWYLDIVADDWDVLVLNDYKAVMPLPKRKKYGLPYIYQPPWVQQLGVFSKKKISKQLTLIFINSIPLRYKKIDFMLHTGNKLDSKHISQRANYILNISRDYKTIFNGFSKGRQGSIKKGQKNELKIMTSDDPIELIKLFKSNIGGKIKKKDHDYFILENLVKQLLELGKIKIYHVFNKNKELLGGAFFLVDAYRITYLFSAINKMGREEQAMSVLIDFVIKSFAKSNFIFDFEGSMIPEISNFFRSFGAKEELYYHYKKINFL